MGGSQELHPLFENSANATKWHRFDTRHTRDTTQWAQVRLMGVPQDCGAPKTLLEDQESFKLVWQTLSNFT